MHLQSPAFKHGKAIPSRFTCEGEDISPALSWSDVPEKAQSLVLIVHDPDAPRPGGFTHWVLYNIPPNVHSIAEAIPRHDELAGLGMQGKNSAGKVGYMGPCPPSGAHRYFLRLFALDQELDLLPGAEQREVEEAMQGHFLATAELMGKYTKSSEQVA